MLLDASSLLLVLVACRDPVPPADVRPPPDVDPPALVPPAPPPRAFDPSWTWVGTPDGLVAYRPDGDRVRWGDGSDAIELPPPRAPYRYRGFQGPTGTAIVDPARGRVVRQRDGHLEAWTDGDLSPLGEASGDWTLDADGSVWVVQGGRAERWSLSGERSPGPTLPEGHELLGVSQGTVCSAHHANDLVDVVCQGSGEQRRTFGTVSGKRSCRVTWAWGWVHHQCGPGGYPVTISSRLWNPTTGEEVHHVPSSGTTDGPDLRVHAATSVWTTGPKMEARGAWTVSAAPPPGWWFHDAAAGIAPDGLHLVLPLVRQGERRSTDALLLGDGQQPHRLGSRVWPVDVVQERGRVPHALDDWPDASFPRH